MSTENEALRRRFKECCERVSIATEVLGNAVGKLAKFADKLDNSFDGDKSRYRWGVKSSKHISTLTPKLKELAKEIIKNPPFDLSIICGWRSKEDQFTLFQKGRECTKAINPSREDWKVVDKSKVVTWTLDSKHCYIDKNFNPCSAAFDIIPYPFTEQDWEDKEKFNQMCDHIQKCADRLEIEIIMGRDWDPKDFPHVELKRGE